MQVKISDIIITNRKRTLKPEYVKQLAESIHEIGLLNPITLSSDYKLLSGMHRLEAIKSLGMEYIDAHVMVSGGILYEELIEIDENLIRNDLTILEQGQQLNRRDEILKALGQRAEQGDNQHSVGSELNSPPKTTAEIAKESGISERTAQHYKQIDKGIDESVKDMIRGTDIEDSKTDLLKIAREKNPEIQAKIANQIINKPHIAYNSGNNEWYTPSEYIESARVVMGSIDVDPASSDLANTVVKATAFYTIDNSGLDKEWKGNIWLNPPYSNDLISVFIDKLISEYENNNIKEAIVLVNNATETKWFQNLMNIAISVCFTSGRVKYWCANGTFGAPLQGQTILYVGDNPIGFAHEFIKHGFILHDIDKLFPENI